MEKVIFIGLDAAEPKLVEEWMADGSLPNMKKLFDRGQIRTVGHPEDVVIHPWSNFYTGQNPGVHGVYHYIVWDPIEMRSKRFNFGELNLSPFWRNFPKNGPRVVAIDMPMANRPNGCHGVEVHGWATHEVLEPIFTCPPGLIKEIREQLGTNLKIEERSGIHSGQEIIKVREELIQTITHATNLSLYLMETQEWDLLLMAFLGLHLGGHKLWDLSGIDSDLEPDVRSKVLTSLKSLYQLCDQGIGRIIQKAPKNCTLLVGSFHGMGPSTSRSVILPQLISKIVHSEKNDLDKSQQPRFLSTIRDLIPLDVRHFIKKNLPYKLKDWLTSFWRLGGINWDQTPVFALVSDYDGYVRINLKGREAKGIVSPGDEYEYWVNKIVEGLSSFLDQDTQKSIIGSIIRRDDLDLVGPHTELFPDLFVIWSSNPAAEHRVIESQIYGDIPWPTPGKNPDGRSGNHLPKGFLISSGSGFLPKDRERKEITPQDVTVTIYDLFNLDIPEIFVGRSFLKYQ